MLLGLSLLANGCPQLVIYHSIIPILENPMFDFGCLKAFIHEDVLNVPKTEIFTLYLTKLKALLKPGVMNVLDGITAEKVCIFFQRKAHFS